MVYEIVKDGIKIFDKQSFNPQHILECGQVFCFENKEDKYIVFPQNQYAEIIENEKYYLINTKNPDFFVNYFDLSTNYSKIKKELSKFEILQKPLKFGYGIRILKQDLFETLISFIISANNNIKRIKLILNNIRRELGQKIKDDVYSFPSYDRLKECDESFFKRMGAGYRAGYLVKVLSQTTPAMLEEWRELETAELRNKLIALSGIGPKVADCILLFGYNKGDVFPVDTWIAQMYNSFFSQTENRIKMREDLVAKFGQLSGYAQQYLFYYQRSFVGEKD
ncbi:MAG: DNA glycosylase [Clostridia bacterium]|nr:DNA glycosylase [Clostridia bacterium]